jgi:hypothetical protein
LADLTGCFAFSHLDGKKSLLIVQFKHLLICWYATAKTRKWSVRLQQALRKRNVFVENACTSAPIGVKLEKQFKEPAPD